MQAREYQPLIVAYRNGAPVRLSDVANVLDSVEDIRTAGLVRMANPPYCIIIFRQPGANIIDTVDRVRAVLAAAAGLASRRRSIFGIVLDRTTTIRASVDDVECTLIISIALVILVVFAIPAQCLGDT